MNKGIQDVESSIRFKSDHWASHDLCCSACMASDNVRHCHHLGRLTSIHRGRQSDELAWTTSDNEGNCGPAFRLDLQWQLKLCAFSRTGRERSVLQNSARRK